jgi:hypothetical protein
MHSNTALIERRGRVALVTINRPEARNAVNRDVWLGVGRALASVGADPDLWAVVLTGAGDVAFCAGADLKAGARGEDIRDAADERDDLVLNRLTRAALRLVGIELVVADDHLHLGAVDPSACVDPLGGDLVDDRQVPKVKLAGVPGRDGHDFEGVAARMPAAAAASAVARPMPLAAPVITATRSSSEFTR